MPITQRTSSRLISTSLTKVAIPRKRIGVSRRSAKTVNRSSNEVAWAARASAMTPPKSADKNIEARLNASFQLKARVDSRLQCSVVRIWSRTPGGRRPLDESCSTPLACTSAATAPSDQPTMLGFGDRRRCDQRASPVTEAEHGGLIGGCRGSGRASKWSRTGFVERAPSARRPAPDPHDRALEPVVDAGLELERGVQPGLDVLVGALGWCHRARPGSPGDVVR